MEWLAVYPKLNTIEIEDPKKDVRHVYEWMNVALIAFAFHQVFELTDKLYQACRQHFGSKRHLWENLRANLRTFIFDNWEYLLNFTLNPENYISGRLPAPD